MRGRQENISKYNEEQAYYLRRGMKSHAHSSSKEVATVQERMAQGQTTSRKERASTYISALFSPRMTSLCKQQLPSRKATRVHATVYSLHSRQCGIDDRRPQSITRSLTLVGVARMSLEQAMAGDQFNSKLDTGDGGAAGRLHAMMSRQGDLCQE